MSAPAAAADAAAARTRAILAGPPLPLLLRLAAPNALAFFVQACVNMAEVWYVGRLGTSALAAMALAFPFLMLMQTMSGGAIGGAVSSSVARALGAGKPERASALLWHALAIALGGALIFFALFAAFGRALLARLGGSGAELAQAAAYLDLLFAGGAALWLNAILASAFRGLGEMRFPALLMVLATVVQVPLSGALILGWWGAPALGISGAAISVLAVAGLSALVSFLRLRRGIGTVRLARSHFALERSAFADILRVGALSALSPILTVLTVVAVNASVATFGAAALAGYGIGARLEFLLIPLVFGLGAAMNATVGINVGAAQLERAHQIAWTGAAVAGALTGTIGHVLAIWPQLWVGLFTDDPATFATGAAYLRTAGPAYVFQGIGLSLYFASQGARAVLWPVIAVCLRFAIAVGGGALAVSVFGLGPRVVFACIAVGIAAYGLTTALAIRLGAWRRA
jgi:putative MATE family efflux protein